MNRRRKIKILLATSLAVFAFSPNPLWACAACYGQSDAPMAKGMNWGIFTLLGVVVFVLGSVATFFVYLAKKSATAAGNAAPAAALLESTHKA